MFRVGSGEGWGLRWIGRSRDDHEMRCGPPSIGRGSNIGQAPVSKVSTPRVSDLKLSGLLSGDDALVYGLVPEKRAQRGRLSCLDSRSPPGVAHLGVSVQGPGVGEEESGDGWAATIANVNSGARVRRELRALPRRGLPLLRPISRR
jgi:hypothetical protein